MTDKSGIIEKLKNVRISEIMDSYTDKKFKEELNTIIDKINEIINIINK